MYYINMKEGPNSKGHSITRTILEETEKSILIRVRYSRFPEDRYDFLFRKSQLLSWGPSAIVAKEIKVFKEQQISPRSFDFVCPDPKDMESTSRFVASCIAQGHMPSQEEIDAKQILPAAPVAPAAPAAINRSAIMKRAWQIARESAAKFGGSAKSYISQAMKMAWAEAR